MSDAAVPDVGEEQTQAAVGPADSREPVEEITRQSQPSRRAIIILVVLVCAIGMLAGGLFGQMAGMGYATVMALDTYQHALPDPSVYERDGPPSFEDWNWRPYRVFDHIGSLTGIAAGLLSAHLWCRSIFWLTKRKPRTRMVLHGTWIGIVCGLVATLVLHAVLGFAHVHLLIDPLVIGLLCALVSGAIAGAICGAVFSLISRRGDLGERALKAAP